jgi:hypothetical protein
MNELVVTVFAVTRPVGLTDKAALLVKKVGCMSDVKTAPDAVYGVATNCNVLYGAIVDMIAFREFNSNRKYGSVTMEGASMRSGAPQLVMETHSRQAPQSE